VKEIGLLEEITLERFTSDFFKQAPCGGCLLLLQEKRNFLKYAADSFDAIQHSASIVCFKERFGAQICWTSQ